MFGSKYFYILKSDKCSSCSCKWFSLKFTQHVTIKPGSNSEKTVKHAANCSKAVCWGVKCINCSYNNVAIGIRLLDKKAIFVYTGKRG